MTNQVSLEKRQNTQDSSVDVAAEMERIRELIQQQVSPDVYLKTRTFEDTLNQVRANWNVQSFQFESSVPVIGSSIAAFRAAWNSIATKWQVRHILGQQNNFNLTVYHLFQELCQEVGDLSRKVVMQDQRTRELSRDAQQLVEEVEHGKAVLDEVVERLEEFDLRLICTRNLMCRAGSAKPLHETMVVETPSTNVPSSEGYDYLGFNAKFTALSSVVRKTYRQYLPLFEGRDTILDAGCGQGHFLELLHEIEVNAYGVDIDAEMVGICRLKGFEAQVGDVIAHLADLPDQSLGGIFSGHLVEHLAPPVLQRFLALAYKSLRPGGVLVCETPNTESLFVLANTFYRDPTHQRPLHPETYQFMAQAEGFVDVALQYSLPAPGDWAIELIDVPDDLDSSLRTIVRELNERLRRIDEQVFGYQNVALIARRADRASGVPK